MRAMPWRWRVGVAVGVVALTVVAVAVFASVHRRAIEASFRSQGVAFAVAFADAAEAWLAAGDAEAIERAARLMFLGSVLYVQVVSHGVVHVDARREPLVPEELPRLDGSPRILQAEYRGISAGIAALDVAVPLLEGGSGHVRVGLDTGEIVAGVRAGMLVAAGIGIGLDLVVFGVLFGVGRRRPERGALEGEVGPDAVRIGDLVIEGLQKRVTLAGRPVVLPPKPYALLSLLASQPGRVFSDREILAAVWSDSRYANAKDVKQHVYLLRKRLRDAKSGGEEMIVNVPGFGYRLEPRGNGD